MRGSVPSTRSFGVGRPTTGRRCPAGLSLSWIPTRGSSLTSGPSTATRTNRDTGSQAGTTARSTRPGATDGCSEPANPASTYGSSPGQRSSDIGWCPALRRPTIRLWRSSGPGGVANRRLHWTAPDCVCYRHSMAAARPAEISCCMPTTSRKAPRVGAVDQDHPHRDPQTSDHRGCGSRPVGRSRHIPPDAHPLPPSTHRRRGKGPAPQNCTRAHRDCLSRDAVSAARPVLRGDRRSNAAVLPDKRQALHAGIGFTELSNGFAATDDPARLQRICDRLGPEQITAFADHWFAVLPVPLTATDQAAGYWWELSMRQIEVSRTIVFAAPRHARGFFEALVADNLDIGRPEQVELIFGRRTRGAIPPAAFKTKVVTRGVDVTVNAFYKHSRIKQYLNCDARSHAMSEYVGLEVQPMLKT